MAIFNSYVKLPEGSSMGGVPQPRTATRSYDRYDRDDRFNDRRDDRYVRDRRDDRGYDDRRDRRDDRRRS